MKLSQTGYLVDHHILISAQPHIKEVKHCERWVVRPPVCVTSESELNSFTTIAKTLQERLEDALSGSNVPDRSE